VGLLVQHKVKIVATVSSNKNATQLTSFVNSTVFPRFSTRVTDHFSAIFKPGTLSSISVRVAYVFPHPTIARQYQLYPKFLITGELLDGLTMADFLARWQAFVDGCIADFRAGMTSFGGVTLISFYFKDVNGGGVTIT
jgi:hypothetical protein